MEYDVLDRALAVAESTTWRCPDEHSDDLDSGRMAGCDVAQASLAERARTEARDGGPAAPSEPLRRSTTPDTGRHRAMADTTKPAAPETKFLRLPYSSVHRWMRSSIGAVPAGSSDSSMWSPAGRVTRRQGRRLSSGK
ncbi:hypothetical protein [Kitasatospora sp. NPDC004531]